MTSFVIFFSYQTDAWRRMVADPIDRTGAVRTTIEAVGGELQDFFYLPDDWTGMAIMEAADTDTAASVAMTITASGAFDRVRVHRLLKGAELVPILQRAQKALTEYVTPGG